MAKTRRDSRRTGIWPLAYLGVEPISPPLLLTDNRPPTTQDYKNFNVGTMWVDRSTAPLEDIWMLVNKDENVARWIKISVVGGAVIETLTGNVGGAVGPDALKNIDILGSGPFTFTGDPATWKLTLSHDGTLATQYDGNTGSATAAAGILQILGGTNATTVAGGNTVTINIDGTVASQYDTNLGSAVPSGGILQVLGGELINTTGGTNIVTANLDRGTDGQVIIAATGATSAYANITSAGGTIVVSEGPNTINLEASGVTPTLGYSNIGMTVDTGASTITIHSASGAAFSASNAGIATFASKVTPGIFVSCTVTSNVSIDWSNMDGNTMGTEGAKAWADELPLYVYAVLNAAENDCTFGLARVPHHRASGVLANIGTPASATADSDMSLFLFESVTIADYDDNPALPLGAIRATKNASDQWSFVAVKGGSSGIGGFLEDSIFSQPLLQLGAINDCLWSAGTPPQWTSAGQGWRLMRSGNINISNAYNGLTAAGIGGNTFRTMVPIQPGGGSNAGIFCVGTSSVSVAAVRGVYRGIPFSIQLANGFYGMEFIKNENRRLLDSDFDTITGDSSQFTGSITFRMLNNELP